MRAATTAQVDSMFVFIFHAFRKARDEAVLKLNKNQKKNNWWKSDLQREWTHLKFLEQRLNKWRQRHVGHDPSSPWLQKLCSRRLCFERMIKFAKQHGWFDLMDAILNGDSSNLWSNLTKMKDNAGSIQLAFLLDMVDGVETRIENSTEIAQSLFNQFCPPYLF